MNQEHTPGLLPPLLEMDVREMRDHGREFKIPLYILATLTDVQALTPRDVGIYKKNLTHRNTELLWAAESRFNPIFYPFYEDVDVLLTGSHARLENRFALPPDRPTWDIILVGKNDQRLQECRELLFNKVEEGILPPINPDVETINVQREKPLSVYGNTHSAWPDRLMYSHVLSGSRSHFFAADERISNEWEQSPEIKKNVLNTYQRFVRSIETGIYSAKQQFDTETGEIYYSPTDKVFGLKFGPLRVLQLFFAIDDLSQRWKRIRPSYETNILKRLESFFPNEAETVRFAYDQALCVHHWQQMQSSLEKDATLHLGKEQLRSITQPILDFVKRYPAE
jgi:hypothetical protein